MNPTYEVANDLSEYVQITPVSEDSIATLPADVVAISSQLPLGAFLIVNKTQKQIMAVSVDWSFLDNKGEQQNRTYFCDGYLGFPYAPVVGRGESSLITPAGCTREGEFHSLVSGSLLRISFENGKAFAAPAGFIERVTIAVDSVLFSDGEVVGRDHHDYASEITLRDQAMRSVLASLEPVGDREAADIKLAAFSSNAAGSRDKLTRLQGRWAGMLKRSPNLNGTIAGLKNAAPIPTFFRSKQERQE